MKHYSEFTWTYEDLLYFFFVALNNQINAARLTQCSAECGPGSQQRSVVCLMKSDEGFTVMEPYECSSLERPLSQQSCHLKACGAKWYHTDWSGVRLATSVSCSLVWVFYFESLSSCFCTFVTWCLTSSALEWSFDLLCLLV